MIVPGRAYRISMYQGRSEPDQISSPFELLGPQRHPPIQGSRQSPDDNEGYREQHDDEIESVFDDILGPTALQLLRPIKPL